MTHPTPPGSLPMPGCPVRGDHALLRLYGPEFAADPHTAYAELRQYGDLAPVEIAPGVSAMLVTDYRTALDLLHDPETWSHDPRPWQETIPEDSPVRPMLAWRPNPLFNDGAVHARYRSVITDSFRMIESHELRSHVHRAADTLITEFGATGRADLISQYARVLPMLLFNRLFGFGDSHSTRLIDSLAGMMEGNTPEEAGRANAAFEAYVTDLVTTKSQERGHDLTSWFIDHPSGLSTEEVVHHVVLTLGAGLEPTTNLVGNALARMLSDDRYYTTLTGGALTAHDAVNEVLWHDPPMANYGAHFPRRDVYFHGTWIRAGQLVLVSYAAANLSVPRCPETIATGAGSHLAWSAGPHTCPVRNHAQLVAITAIERLTAWLSDIELAVPYDQLEWRPGGFHRALATLPARFTPLVPDPTGVTPWNTSSLSSPSTPQDRTSGPRPNASATAARPSW
ncbi:cytochrome P450 [Streptomyces sp. NPDC001922]|uniref:cytochrome P450 n=1 Tax=Streptomyces sp. NPDC001922 TaxID=3364624 RepID=UPI00369B97FD